VVVVRMVAPQRPESAVHLDGAGTCHGPSRFLPALRHQPVPRRKATIATIDAKVDSGRMELPGTLAPNFPSESIFVSAEYGAYAVK
jgi:hypothetical protein